MSAAVVALFCYKSIRNKRVETACDLNNRGGYESIISQGVNGSIEFEIYYRETSNEPPITYELCIGLDK